MSLLVLSAADVERIILTFGPDELADLMARVFSSLSNPSIPSSAQIQQPHRISLSMRNHTSLFMPSRISSMGSTMKVVSVPLPSASQAAKEGGLPASTVILDEATGNVRAIVNARQLTALRNSAGSLLATRILYTDVPKCLLAFGAGAQISAHVSLFLTYYSSVKTCIIFNRARNARLATLVSSLAKAHPDVHFRIGILSPYPSSDHQNRDETPGDADLYTSVREADIIVTATSSTIPLFPSAYVKPGAHLCLIGSYTPRMHEIDSDLVKRAGKVVVDSRDACMREAGEIISAGLQPQDLAEVGELVQFDGESGTTWVPRNPAVRLVQTAGDVTIFKSVGVGAQDVAIALAVVDRAEEEAIGTRILHYDTSGA